MQNIIPRVVSGWWTSLFRIQRQEYQKNQCNHVVYNVVRERRLAKGLCRIVSAALIELDSIEAFELFRWEFQEGCLKFKEC